MIQGRRRESLLLKAAQSIGITGQRGGQDFDGDFAIEPRIFSTPHLTHPARANPGEYFVVTEPSARANHHSSNLRGGC